MFIEQLKDIVDRVKDMLSEDIEGRTTSDQSWNKENEGGDATRTEVRTERPGREAKKTDMKV